MMSRASRMLKWVGAGTVLLAAAPIAYAEPVASSPLPHAQHSQPARHAQHSEHAHSASCGDAPADYAGVYTVAGPTSAAFSFDLTSAQVTQPYFGMPTWPGTWQAGDGTITWNVEGLTYTSKPGTATCADPFSADTVTAFTATTADGSDTLTLLRR